MPSAAAAADAPGNAEVVADANKSKEDRLAALLSDGEDLPSGGEDEEEASPPSLSPRSLRALQQRVKGAQGVDPNIVGSSGGIW